MRKKYLYILVPLALLSAMISAAEVSFVADYDEALELAARQNRHMLISFYADWCGYCKKLDTITYMNDSVAAFTEQLVCVKVNAEVDTLTRHKYGVGGFPTIVLADSLGKEIDRIYGYAPPDQFVSLMSDYLEGKNTLVSYLAEADSAPSPSIWYAIAGKYVGRRDYPVAEKYFRKILQDDPANKLGYADSALYDLGEMKTRAKQYAAAEEIFSRFGDTYPESDLADDALYGIAKARQRDRQYDAAIAAYRSVLDNTTDDDLRQRSKLSIAYSMEMKGDIGSALFLYRNFLQEHPDSRHTDYASRRLDGIENKQKP